jgi:hypothetical protein
MVQHSWMMTQVQPEHIGAGVTGSCDCLPTVPTWLYTRYLMKVAVPLYQAEEKMYLMMLSQCCFGSFISWSRHKRRSIFLLSQATKLHSRHKLNYTETEIRELDRMRWRQEDNHVSYWAIGYSGRDPLDHPWEDQDTIWEPSPIWDLVVVP